MAAPLRSRSRSRFNGGLVHRQSEMVPACQRDLSAGTPRCVGADGGGVPLLILGADGQVGRALVERGGLRSLGCDRAACDITDPAAVTRSLSSPALSAVVNCAAYTAVDRAESDREAAYAIDAEGAGIVARASAARGLPVIHLSTDYVYAGTCGGPHREDEALAPVNVYGASKAAGDAAVAA